MGPVLHQLFQTQEQIPISDLGQSGHCGGRVLPPSPMHTFHRLSVRTCYSFDTGVRHSDGTRPLTEAPTHVDMEACRDSDTKRAPPPPHSEFP